MTDDLDVFFQEAQATGGPARDWLKRPMLVPRGAPAGHRVPYTRASSYSDFVGDKGHLHTWQMRYLAISLSKPDRADLRHLLAGEKYQTHLPEPTDPEALKRWKEEKKASAYRVDSQIERALDRQGIHAKADRGTAVHSFCEPDANLADVPEDLFKDVHGYRRAVEKAGYKELETERFMANDRVLGAGTIDCFVECPDGRIRPGDRKTGRLDPSFAVQLGIYSQGDFYDHTDDSRQTLHERFGDAYTDDYAVIFDIKTAGTKIYKLDIELGRRMADAIHMLRENMVVDKVYELLHDFPKEDPVLTRIANAESRDDLLKIRERAGSSWSNEHSDAANTRWKELP